MKADGRLSANIAATVNHISKLRKVSETMALPRMVIAQFEDLEFGLLAEHTFGLYQLRSDELVATQGTLYSASASLTPAN